MVNLDFRCECGSRSHTLLELPAWSSCGAIALALIERGAKRELEDHLGEPATAKCNVCGATRVHFVNQRERGPHAP